MRPVASDGDKVTVRIGLTLNQIIHVVSYLRVSTFIRVRLFN